MSMEFDYERPRELAPGIFEDRRGTALVPDVIEPTSATFRKALEGARVAVPERGSAVHLPTLAELDPKRADDRAIGVALEALDDGRQLVDIADVARAMDSQRYAHFAIAPATASGKRVMRDRDRRTGDVMFTYKRWHLTLPNHARTEAHRSLDRHVRSYTVVPYVPPSVREHFSPLKDRLIIWETEWAEPGERIRMHIDPALVERVTGNLYVVLAVWDLTPLERAALGG